MYIFTNQHTTYIYTQLADAKKRCDVLALPYSEIERDDRCDDEPIEWVEDCIEQNFSVCLHDTHMDIWLEYNTIARQWVEIIDEIAQNTYTSVEISRLLHQIQWIVVDFNNEEIYITATSEFGYTHE